MRHLHHEHVGAALTARRRFDRQRPAASHFRSVVPTQRDAAAELAAPLDAENVRLPPRAQVERGEGVGAFQLRYVDVSVLRRWEEEKTGEKGMENVRLVVDAWLRHHTSV